MHTEKLDFKKVLPIFVIVLIDLLGVTIILPLLPFYATAFGANPLVIGILGASYPLMQFVGAPLLGRLSDQYGRKPILILSQIGTLLGFVLLGFAGALWMLFLSRIIDGLSGANISTAQAAITDSTTEKTRTQGLGLIGAAFGLGFIIGPIIAFVTLALTNNDYRIPAFVAAGFSLISILLTTFWFQETLDPAHRGVHHKGAFSFEVLVRAVTSPVVGILLILVFAQQLAFGGFENFFSLFTLSRLGLNASENAAIFVWVGLILVAVQGGLVGKWSRRFGDRPVMLAGMGLLAVGLGLSALTPMIPPPWYDPAHVASSLRYGTPNLASLCHPATITAGSVSSGCFWRKFQLPSAPEFYSPPSIHSSPGASRPRKWVASWASALPCSAPQTFSRRCSQASCFNSPEPARPLLPQPFSPAHCASSPSTPSNPAPTKTHPPL